MKSITVSVFSTVLVFCLIVISCAPPSLTKDVPTPVQTPNNQRTPTPTLPTEPTMPKTTLSPELQEVAKNATAILVETMNISPEDVIIQDIQRVVWRDGSLGCPKPGMMYTQALTPGYLVQVKVKGEVRMVHMDERGRGVICSSDHAKTPGAINPDMGK